jgi:hypothetical protein
MRSSSDTCPASTSFMTAMEVIVLEMLPMRIIVVGSIARAVVASARPTAPAQFRVPAVDVAKESPVRENSVRALRRVFWTSTGQVSNVSGTGCAYADAVTRAARATRTGSSMAGLLGGQGRDVLSLYPTERKPPAGGLMSRA